MPPRYPCAGGDPEGFARKRPRPAGAVGPATDKHLIEPGFEECRRGVPVRWILQDNILHRFHRCPFSRDVDPAVWIQAPQVTHGKIGCPFQSGSEGTIYA